MDSLQTSVVNSIIENADIKDLIRIRDKTNEVLDKKWVRMKTEQFLENELSLWKNVPGLEIRFNQEKVLYSIKAKGHRFYLHEGDFNHLSVYCDDRCIPWELRNTTDGESDWVCRRKDLDWMSKDMCNQLSALITNEYTPVHVYSDKGDWVKKYTRSDIQGISI